MATIIEMPKLSDTMSVGTVVKWHKKKGDTISNGDVLAEIETDKATMELECFDDGTLLKIFVGEGEEVPIGSPLAAVGEDGETVEDLPSATTGEEVDDGSDDNPLASLADKPEFKEAREKLTPWLWVFSVFGFGMALLNTWRIKRIFKSWKGARQYARDAD